MDNVLDRQRQGTWGNALSEDTVRKIVIDLDAGLTQSIIAAKHGTTQTTVSSINLGKTWNHVTNRRNALLHRLSTFSLL
jgi:transcriptional regulator